jgi:hypothetical protein
VFERHKEKKALEQYQAELAQWQSLHDGYAEMIQLAQGPGGFDSNEIILKKGEHVVAKVTSASLVEDRRGRGTYTGGSQGVSIPVGSIHGRSVRYRVGATRGHYVQGAPVPTAIDVGIVFITNQRVIFQGTKQTRECLFAKLIGIEHDDSAGTTVVSVSNRQKPTVIHYGPAIAGWFDFRTDFALAQFKGTVAELVQSLQTELAGIEQTRPVQPSTS